MDQERSEVREVEDARRRVAEDVRNVAENANVVERAKEAAHAKIDAAKDAVTDRVGDVRDRLADAKDAMQDSVQGAAQGAAQNIRNLNPSENPLGMLFAGLAVGFLIGLVLPVTRFESERFGPLTENMRDRAQQMRAEVVRRGGEVIKETIDSARETATTSIREQTRDMGLGGESEET